LGAPLGLLEGVLLQSQQILYPGVQFLCLEDFHGSRDDGWLGKSQAAEPGTNALSVASGQQYQGTSCNKIPGDLFNSIGMQMILVTGRSRLFPLQSGTNIFTINDTFDMIRGKHDIMGGGIRINQMNVRAEGFQDGFWIVSGDWTGSSMADMVG
jgi:hypothetical protein